MHLYHSSKLHPLNQIITTRLQTLKQIKKIIHIYSMESSIKISIQKKFSQPHGKIDEHITVKVFQNGYIQSGYKRNHTEKPYTFG